VVQLAAFHRLPAVYPTRDFVEVGGLMSCGTHVMDAFRQLGIYAGRILKGAKPADLPVVQSSKFDLVINAETARMLSLAVPPMLIARPPTRCSNKPIDCRLNPESMSCETENSPGASCS
jgi:putative ABC transport system substrate-binding protein